MDYTTDGRIIGRPTLLVTYPAGWTRRLCCGNRGWATHWKMLRCTIE